jgi:hypothetical protein
MLQLNISNSVVAIQKTNDHRIVCIKIFTVRVETRTLIIHLDSILHVYAPSYKFFSLLLKAKATCLLSSRYKTRNKFSSVNNLGNLSRLQLRLINIHMKCIREKEKVRCTDLYIQCRKSE